MPIPVALFAHCAWRQDDGGSWDSSCGHKWEFIVGGPKENGMKFCCYCGKSLIEEPFKDDDDEN